MKVKCQVNQSNVQTFQTFLFFICPLDGVNSNIFCYLFGKTKCIMLWTDSFLKGRDIRRRKNNCNAIVVDDRGFENIQMKCQKIAYYLIALKLTLSVGWVWMVLETLETTHSVSVAFRSMAVIVFQLKNTTIQITPLKVPTIFKMYYSIIVWKWECRWDLSSLKRKDNLILVEGPRPYSAPTCNRVRRLKAAMTKVLQNFSSGGPIEHLFNWS